MTVLGNVLEYFKRVRWSGVWNKDGMVTCWIPLRITFIYSEFRSKARIENWNEELRAREASSWIWEWLEQSFIQISNHRDEQIEQRCGMILKTLNFAIFMRFTVHRYSTERGIVWLYQFESISMLPGLGASLGRSLDGVDAGQSTCGHVANWPLIVAFLVTSSQAQWLDKRSHGNSISHSGRFVTIP